MWEHLLLRLATYNYSYKEFLKKMKKQYIAPAVTTYGSVESITKAVGFRPIDDNASFNGVPLGVPTDGSSDIDFGNLGN